MENNARLNVMQLRIVNFIMLLASFYTDIYFKHARYISEAAHDEWKEKHQRRHHPWAPGGWCSDTMRHLLYNTLDALAYCGTYRLLLCWEYLLN